VQKDQATPTDPITLRKTPIAPNEKGRPKAALFMNTVLLAAGDVHRDFKAKAHFGKFGLGPHGVSPQKLVIVPKLPSRLVHITQPTMCIVRRSAGSSQRNTLKEGS
jgi:hypothetical protein